MAVPLFLKVMVPVGRYPPVMVALIVMLSPILGEAIASTVMVGVACVTVSGMDSGTILCCAAALKPVAVSPFWLIVKVPLIFDVPICKLLILIPETVAIHVLEEV